MSNDNNSSSNGNWVLDVLKELEKQSNEAVLKQELREATSDFPWVGKIHYATTTPRPALSPVKRAYNGTYGIVDSFTWDGRPYEELPNWYTSRVQCTVGKRGQLLHHTPYAKVRTEIDEQVSLLHTGAIAITLPGCDMLFQLSSPTTVSSGDPNNMFDFRVMNDDDWEYLSEMNRAREEAEKSAEKVKCKEHEWINISLLNVKEVCKVCDVERDVVEGKK
jgi:hypothetical protein